METLSGIVLREQKSNSGRGKFIDILTEKDALLQVFVRTSGKNTSESTASTQMFSYARFSITERNGQNYLDSSVPIRLFYHLRDSVSRLALAMYFSRLLSGNVGKFPTKGESQGAILRLTLNTLHFLEKGTREEILLKPLFELRLMTELGSMPNLLICETCGAYLPERAYFSIREGRYVCADCATATFRNGAYRISAGVLQAMRHIVFSEFNRLYNFRLQEDLQKDLQECVEQFFTYHMNTDSSTLSFYKTVRDCGNLYGKENL